MMLMNDEQIIRAIADGMIDGAQIDQVRTGVISYGVTSFGYDMRVANEWQLWSGDKVSTIDPKRRDLHTMLRTEVANTMRIPPNEFALCRSVEYFRIPDDVMCIVVGKSTYARCGLVVNVTPLEPGWEGYVTIELSNTSPLPIRVYANEGIAQVLFFQGQRPRTTYGDKRGKYQRQQGIVLPRIEGGK